MGDYLGLVSSQLAKVIVPMIISFGIVGNIVNIIVLTRPKLYNHACSRYFLALSISSLAYSSINLSYRLLADGYQIDPAKYSTVSCKTITYITQLCYPMPPYFIVLASIDRCCTSSSSIRIRQISSIRVSRWAIFLVVTTFVLLYINSPIIVDLRPEDGLGCRNRGNTIYKRMYAVTQCVLFAVLAPVFMIIFGLLTIYNTKKVAYGRVLTSRYRRTEQQLILMLLVQVGMHILLTLPASIIYPILVLSMKRREVRLVLFIYSICNIFFHLSYTSAFPLYFLTAKVYRSEFVRLLTNLLRCHADIRVKPAANNHKTVELNTIVQTKPQVHYRTHSAIL